MSMRAGVCRRFYEFPRIEDYGVRISYALQDRDDGGVMRCDVRRFSDGDSVAVILGDNIIEQNLPKLSNNSKRSYGIFEVPDLSGQASRCLTKK